MDWLVIAIAGILFDALVKIVSQGHAKYLRGIDSLPAVPILAGYLYGSGTGFWCGLVVSLIYCIIRVRIDSAPLIIGSNALIGFAAAFLAPVGLLYAGIAMLVIYHIISFAYSALFSETGPGYIAFTVLNFIFTVSIFWILSIL